MFSPIRIRKLVSPVTVHSGARSLAWKIAELTSSLNQSISQNARPGEDDVPAPALDLDRVDVEREPEQRDGGPLERVAVAQDVERLLRLLGYRENVQPELLERDLVTGRLHRDLGELPVLLDRAVLRARHVVEAAAARLLAQAVDVVQHAASRPSARGCARASSRR